MNIDVLGAFLFLLPYDYLQFGYLIHYQIFKVLPMISPF